jgi:UDP-glucuronate 4-epimerase
MKILVTGSAGFIGSALSIKLLDRGDTVLGIDNHNDYYNPKLKELRLSRHSNHKNYTHFRENIEDRGFIKELFQNEKFDCVVCN